MLSRPKKKKKRILLCCLVWLEHIAKARESCHVLLRDVLPYREITKILGKMFAHAYFEKKKKKKKRVG